MKFSATLKKTLFTGLGLVSLSFNLPASAAVNPVTSNLPYQLGWVSTPIQHGFCSAQNDLCPGYYVEPKLEAFGESIKTPQQSKTSITFSNATFYKNQPSILSGNVVVIQSGRRLEADRAILYRDPKTGKLVAIDLFGNIRVIESGRLFLGSKAHISLNDKGGEFDNVNYRIVLVDDDQMSMVLKPLNENVYKVTALSGWGQAEKVIQTQPGHIEFQQASYSTCPPTANEWQVSAKNIKIDRDKGRGVARDAKLTVAGIPILYSPYLSFPTSKKRKTGFLFPTISHTNTSGFEINEPFYWNIAPNYDATISPRIFTKRGVLLDSQFRYLTKSSYGKVRFGIIPDDNAFSKFQNEAATTNTYLGQWGLNGLLNASDDRNLFSAQDRTQFNPHWTSNIDYTHVSDDYYFQDFGNIPSVITTNQLLRQAQVQYIGDNWNFSGMAQSYDTLHPVNRPAIGNLYSRLPEFDLNGNFPDAWNDMDFSLENQAVFFTRTIGPTDNNITPPRGSRLNIMPGISAPITKAYGFFIPSLHVAATNYDLQNQLPGYSSDINRGLPIFNVDSGLYFDRDITIANTDYDQTLEPRLYYLFVPYTNQNQIPVFDSAVIPFTYDQLFRTNRFSGDDRIGDANQLSLGFTSRFINEKTGMQKFIFSLGQIYYFRNRRVTICNQITDPGCTDTLTGLGATSNSTPISPVSSQFKYFFSHTWSANGDLAYDIHSRQADSGDYYFQFKPNERKLFNIGYNFLRNGDIMPNQPLGSSKNNLSQILLSLVYPITNRLSTIDMWSYNISQNHGQSYLAGLQYETCCWALRFLGGRTFTALDQNGLPTYSNGVFIQWELKGLANFDPNNASSAIASQISGYQDPFAATNNLYK